MSTLVKKTNKNTSNSSNSSNKLSIKIGNIKEEEPQAQNSQKMKKLS